MRKKQKKFCKKLQMKSIANMDFMMKLPESTTVHVAFLPRSFFKKWNELFKEKVHICFILTQSKDECDHVLILPSGELYDGGIGVHSDKQYKPKFLIEEMINYHEEILEKWSYGLDRTYPRFCSHFDRKFVEKIINSNLDYLSKL